MLQNIDQLYKFASVSNELNMLRNAIRLKAPTYYRAFTRYVMEFNHASVNSETGYLCGIKSIPEDKIPPDFHIWLKLKGLYCDNELKDTKSNVEYQEKNKRLNKKKKETGIHCYECGKKFTQLSRVTLENHYCNPRLKRKSIQTISGGGGPGTGKRK